MQFVMIMGLAVGLSMDAFAVTISNMFTYRSTPFKQALLMPLFFGAFQGIMPLIGYFAGMAVSSLIDQYAGIITFVILSFIGGKMVWDAFHEDAEDTKEEVKKGSVLTVGVLFFQAIATSIDALAVGIMFAFTYDSLNIYWAIAIIGLTTFVLSIIGVIVGNFFGNKYKKKSEIAGGIILILIGVKILLEHLGIISF